MGKYKLKRQDLIYPELSFKIIGVLFDVYNKLGGSYHEKYYQKAIAITLKNNGLIYIEQVFIPLVYNETKIGNYYLDFLIENKVVLEIKKGEFFKKSNIDQVYSYLKTTKLPLGILANFTKTGLRYKRILNII